MPALPSRSPRASASASISAPTAWRRPAIFDAATFGAGYGEENDFCLRARRRGWRHLLAADVFVEHAGGRSFGRRGAALRERNLRILNLRYPGYDALVRRFVEADPIHPSRRRLDEARLIEAGAPCAVGEPRPSRRCGDRRGGAVPAAEGAGAVPAGFETRLRRSSSSSARRIRPGPAGSWPRTRASPISSMRFRSSWPPSGTC